MDSNGSPIPAATLFYNRAKALYDADYEDNRVIIVQALILMGWYWEDPATVTKNVFYWNGLAVTIAHGFGMHRSSKASRLNECDKRLWKRIWWTLFTRDRSVAIALGRPPHINMEDSDVEMISEEDFIDDRTGPEDMLHTQFFLQYVKLSLILDHVYLQHYSVRAKSRKRDPALLASFDMTLADWLKKCPREVRWGHSKYNFWSAYLYIIYQTTVCVLHRAYLPPGRRAQSVLIRSPAFQSADALTSVIAILDSKDEIRFAPPFIIHSLLSSLILHVYELHNTIPGISIESRRHITLCMHALDKLSEIWLVAKCIQSLFEAVLIKAGYGHWLESSASPRNSPQSHHTLKNFEHSIPSTESGDGTRSKSLPLTPALIAYREACLESSIPASLPTPPTEAFPKDGLKAYNDSQIKTGCTTPGVSTALMYADTSSWDAELQYSATGMSRSKKQRNNPPPENIIVQPQYPHMKNSTPLPQLQPQFHEEVRSYGVTEWFNYFGMR